MRVCPSCGENNPDRASFCLGCGSSLSPRLARTQERKIVTILVCDLVGFTARSDRADPEDVKATLRPFHARLKRDLEGHGGTLDKFIGDAAVGVFGAPVSHEDDPERAVRAALRILESVPELNEEHPGLDLAVRIGVATGEAFVSLGPGPQVGERVTGEVVSVAQSLQGVAPVGGIAVSGPTYDATKDLFVYAELDPGSSREQLGPMAVWGPIQARSRLVRERPHTPFVARQEELAMLRAAFRRAIGEPSVQLVTVTGEPGVGKSRLIAEFANYLDEQPELVRWRQGRCLPYGEAVGFWPLSEIVKAESGILETDPPDEAQDKLHRSVDSLVEDPSERDWITARLAPIAGIGGTGANVERSESFTAWRRYLEAMAARHPTVLVFEDLHWAEPSMLEFIEHLVDWSTPLPLLVVCGARPELYERRPGWGGGKRNSATISLPPLSEAETSMLISGLLDQAILPVETQTALLERAGGNPLFAEEFVRMLTDHGVLRRAGRALRLVPVADIPVPETIQALIGARLDTLSPESKALIHDAAVMGKEFWSGSLAAMSGMDEQEVRDRLHEIARKELVRPSRTSSVKDQAEYSFWHILIRDVAYAQIPRTERGGRHLAAAEWIERTGGDRVADQAELLAHHYGQALELARAMGQDTAQLEELSARYLVMAGDRALRFDLSTADGHYRRAYGLLPEHHPERPRILVRIAGATAAAGRFRDAWKEYDEAIADLRASGDVLALGEALALEARAMQAAGDTGGTRRLLEEAVRILEAEPPGHELVRTYSRIAGEHLVSGRYPECLAWSEKSLALAEELEAQDEVVRARQFRGAARCLMGDAAGLADMWAALRLGLDLGLGEETVVTYGNLAWQLWLMDGPAIALQVWTSAVEFAKVRGFTTQMMWSKAGQVECLFDLGRWDEVEAIALEMEEWDRAGGGGQAGTFAQVYLASVLYRRGELDSAVALEERFLPRARELEIAEYVAPALLVGAIIERARGHTSTALDLVREFVLATERQLNFRLHYLPGILRLLADLGRIDEAESLLPDASVATNVRHGHCLLTCRALLAEHHGGPGRAAELHEEAARAWLSYGAVFEVGQAHLGAARCLLPIDPDRAAEHLREARRWFSRVGAVGMVADIDALPVRGRAATS